MNEDDIKEQVKDAARPKITNEVLEEIKRQNNLTLITHKKLDDLIEIEAKKIDVIESMNKRQAKESKFNFPFVFFGTVFGYSAVHISIYGAEHYKAKLIFFFDLVAGLLS